MWNIQSGIVAQNTYLDKYFAFRGMLWKVQSGIVPPLFYVIIAEKDKLKALREFMRSRNAVEQNTAVNPNVQSQQMYPVWLNTLDT